MDAVTQGIIGGVVGAVALISVSVVSKYNPSLSGFINSIETHTWWLIMLSALTIGQLFLSYFMVNALMEAPSQVTPTTQK